MRITYLFLLFLSNLFLACKNDRKEVEPILEKEWTDTSKVALAEGFELYLIKKKIDPGAVPDGFVLYRYIKEVDTLIISEPIGVSTSLKGIEGFTNLRYFSSQGLTVDTLDFSQNKKLEYFDYQPVAHCMFCTTLSVLNFGKVNSLRHLRLASSQVKSFNIDDLKLLNSLQLSNNMGILNLDVSGCKELTMITTIGALSNLTLGDHPKLEIMKCGKALHGAKISKYPALRILHVYCDGVADLDFSKHTELEEAHILDPNKLSIDLTKAVKLKRLVVDGQTKWAQNTIDLSQNRELKECYLFATTIKTICVSSLSVVNTVDWKKDSTAEFKVCD
jgi:hypothetical protein